MKKGISTIAVILYGVITMLVGVLLVLSFSSYGKSSATPIPDIGDAQTAITDSFDHSMYIVNSGDSYLYNLPADSAKLKEYICTNLKRCYIISEANSLPCEVIDFSFMGGITSINNAISLVISCGDAAGNVAIRDEVAEGVFVNLGQSKITNNEAKNLNDVDLQLFYKNCKYTGNLVLTKNLTNIYSDDYFPFTGSLSPGRFKINVDSTDCDVSSATCKAKMTYCYLPAIADSDADSTIDVLNYIRRLEIRPLDKQDMDTKYYYIDNTEILVDSTDDEGLDCGDKDCSEAYRCIDYKNSDTTIRCSSESTYKWKYVEFELNEAVAPSVVVSAIKYGFYENMLRYNSNPYPSFDIHSWGTDSWNVASDGALDFDANCNEDSLSVSGRNIKYNCLGGLCNGNLTIVVGVKQQYSIDGTKIFTTVHFCDDR